MAEILIDGCPTNLRLPEDARAIPINSDLYNVCGRLKEISTKLFVVMLDPPQKSRTRAGAMDNWVIMQHCEDGVERVFFRVEYLDQRVVDKAAEFVYLPLEQRIKAIEDSGRKLEQDQLEDQLDDMYEKIGGQMWHDLERSGFCQRPVSYRKTNRTAQRSRGSRK